MRQATGDGINVTPAGLPPVVRKRLLLQPDLPVLL